jgi:DNA polymerase-3 subunit delta'
VSTAAPNRGFLTIGQPVAERLVRRMLTEGSGPATILVDGPRGAGKGSFVDDVLATALCESASPGERPCNRCAGCARARARTHADLVVASPAGWRDDRGSGESIVSVARRWLTEVAGAPIAGRWRVVVVEHADAASEQVQNALLKALEEPAPRQLFILVADDARRLLPTIRSRSQAVRLGPVPRDELARWLVDTRPMTDEQATTLARLADGRVGRAQTLADRPDLLEWRRRTQHELLALLARGRAERMAAVRELLDDAGPVVAPDADGGAGEEGDIPRKTPTGVQRASAIAIVDAWVDLARDLAVAAAGVPSLAVSAELVPEMLEAAGQQSPAEWALATIALDRIGDALAENVSPRLSLETAMLAWPETAAR